jgi:beta-phosphoglucomutase-like phosphatase (HAD superfamily)
MDGVLVDACEWHRVALNQALQMFSCQEITLEEHFNEYNGLPTKIKLNKLLKKGFIEPGNIELIEKEKQRLTIEIIKKSAGERKEKIALMRFLKSKNIKIGCYTNSIRETAELMLIKTGVLDYIDFLITNQDVVNSKPHPEGYLICINRAQADVKECLIVEDSPKGIEAALASGAHDFVVQSPEDVTIESIESLLE